MGIRSRILLFQLIVGASLLMIAAVVILTIRQSSYYLVRVELANHQLEAITALQVNANRFSEQIAEYLLIGEPERADFDSAGREMAAGFDRLEAVTNKESAFVQDNTGEVREQLDENYRIQRMRTRFDEISSAVAKLFALRDQGRQDEAIQQFRNDIENRLDAELESLLIEARLDEKEEANRTERRAEALWRQLVWITTISTIAVIILCAVSGLLFARSLMRPIELLVKGTEAIGRGELDHRIDFESESELGALVKLFNEMAARRQEQRALLLNAKAGLEQEVAERTAELAAANQRLTDLDRLRVQFLADISHELRTPLTALRGEAEITLRHGSKPETVYREVLDRIVTQTTDMSRLVDDLLFLTRSEADNIRFEPKRTALRTIVSAAAHDGEVLARAKGIPFATKYDAAPIWVRADVQRLKQALMILLDNAVKYTPPGRPVSLSMRAVNGHGEIVIRDAGMGIPAGELPNVFERFYRGKTLNASRQPGTGLGLAIAKWLVEKHNGEISLTSEVGSFTEVRVRIPCLKSR